MVLQVSFHGEYANMVLLVILYVMQGVPLGLTLGSMYDSKSISLTFMVTAFFLAFVDQCGLGATCRPFLLQANASYTAIGIFSLASYPYSFKLLWSPVVDSVYSAAFGRRKSWVVCRWLLQFLCGSPCM
jgi:hypothetical protein